METTMETTRLKQDEIGTIFLPTGMRNGVAIWPRKTRLLVFEKSQSGAMYEYKGFYMGEKGSGTHAESQALPGMKPEKKYIWIMNYSPCDDCTTEIMANSRGFLKKIYFAGQYITSIGGQKRQHSDAFQKLRSRIEPLNLTKWYMFIQWSRNLTRNDYDDLIANFENSVDDPEVQFTIILLRTKIEVKKLRYEKNTNPCYTAAEIRTHRQEADTDAWKVCKLKAVVQHRQDADTDAWKVCPSKDADTTITPQRLNKDEIGELFLPILMNRYVANWCNETCLLVFEKPRSESEYKYKGFYMGGEGSESHPEIQALPEMKPEKEYIWIMNYSPCDDCTTKIKEKFHGNLHIYFAGRYFSDVYAFKNFGMTPLDLQTWIGFILWNLTDMNDKHLIEVLQFRSTHFSLDAFPDEMKKKILETILDRYEIKVKKYNQSEGLYHTSKEVVQHWQNDDQDDWKVCKPKIVPGQSRLRSFSDEEDSEDFTFPFAKLSLSDTE